MYDVNVNDVNAIRTFVKELDLFDQSYASAINTCRMQCESTSTLVREIVDQIRAKVEQCQQQLDQAESALSHYLSLDYKDRDSKVVESLRRNVDNARARLDKAKRALEEALNIYPNTLHQIENLSGILISGGARVSNEVSTTISAATRAADKLDKYIS